MTTIPCFSHEEALAVRQALKIDIARMKAAVNSGALEKDGYYNLVAIPNAEKALEWFTTYSVYFVSPNQNITLSSS